MMGGKIYRLRQQVISRLATRVDDSLCCWRCGKELTADETVFAKASRGACSINTEFGKSHPYQRNRSIPKIYHLACAREVHLID